MDYYETALNYEMTATEAMEMDMSREPLWKVHAAAAHLSTMPVTDWADMSRRAMRREALENHFWERKYAGEALA